MASDQFTDEQDYYFSRGPKFVDSEMNPNIHYVLRLNYKPKACLFKHMLCTSALSEANPCPKLGS
jgi:hypothetical protein